MSDSIVYCVECLRVAVARKRAVVRDPAYGHSGSNDVAGEVRPQQAKYVVDGTWYCATHALPVYEAAATHVILEDA